jgi:hypothetical protein
MKSFAVAVVEVSKPEYLRAASAQDIAQLLEMNKKCGFSGMLGSIDCMRWRWKNSPATWHGQFRWHENDPTIFLKSWPIKRHGYVIHFLDAWFLQ